MPVPPLSEPPAAQFYAARFSASLPALGKIPARPRLIGAIQRDAAKTCDAQFDAEPTVGCPCDDAGWDGGVWAYFAAGQNEPLDSCFTDTATVTRIEEQDSDQTFFFAAGVDEASSQCTSQVDSLTLSLPLANQGEIDACRNLLRQRATEDSLPAC